jgi:hypothetical protein
MKSIKLKLPPGIKLGRPKNPWANIGIHGESRFEEVLYSTITQKIIAHFSREPHLFSLYSRGIEEKRYRRLTPKSGRLSYWDPVPVLSRPLLYTNVMRKKKTGFFWDCVAAINLRTGKLRRVITSRNLKAPAPYPNKNSWVSKLLSASADGRHLICVVGFERKISDTFWHMDYWLCDFDLSRKSLKQLSLLQNTSV